MSKPFEPDDPLEPVALTMPAVAGYDHLTAMARCFIEEYLMMGWEAKRILALFRTPFFRGPHAVYRAKGEAYVQALIDDVMRKT
ncbi:MAG: hypothetical protein ACE5LU_01280 [Anaerolineae bacterium]